MVPKTPHSTTWNNGASREKSFIFLILAGFGAGLAFWIVAAFAEGLTHQRSLFDELFHPLPDHLLTRLTAILGFFVFTVTYALLRRSEHKFRLSQQRLHAIIETEPECVNLLDAQGRLLEMNPAGLRMIEADSLDQVRGQCIYPIVTEDYRDAFIALTKRVFEGQSGRLDFEIIGLKGSHRWLETSAVPLHDRNNKSKIDTLSWRSLATLLRENIPSRNFSGLNNVWFAPRFLGVSVIGRGIFSLTRLFGPMKCIALLG